MRTYLLTWNPATTPWEELEENSNQTASGYPIETSWSCGKNKSIVKGDRVFLLIQGKNEPRGIIGAGWVVSEKVVIKPHWDEAKAKEGKTAPRILVNWDRLLDPYSKKSTSATSR